MESPNLQIGHADPSEVLTATERRQRDKACTLLLTRSQRNPTGECSCFYYLFMAVVVIRYETKATARRALTFIVCISVNDTIAITVWASFCFHVAAGAGGSGPWPCEDFPKTD